MEKVIGSLIHNNQSGFIKGRFIGEGIRFMDDLIEYMDKTNKPGLALQLDFEKAFDSVEWYFLFEALRKFGFGPDFIQWVRVCYKDIFSTVGKAGHSTGWFKILRGVRQGCPLSCLLFILVAEILAQRIRNNTSIEGITFGAVEHKIFQFADDTTCTLKNENSITELFCLVDKFTQHSGLKLNVNKTIMIWLGPWRTKCNNRLNLKTQSGSFNMLGIHLGRCNESNNTQNLWNKIAKMTKHFNIWNGRNLTLMGKILISKTYGISNLIYSLTMVDVDTDIKEKAQKELSRFIWNAKPPKIKHSTLIVPIEKGGLKTVDFNTMVQSLRLAWLARLLDDSDWSNIARYYFDKYGGLLFLLRCNYKCDYLEIPKFYSHLLHYARNTFEQGNSHEILWNNKDILIDNSSVFYKDWLSKGIIYIQDLCRPDGTWLNYTEFCNKFQLRNCFLQFNGLLMSIKSC
jgi:hypothetical protein